MNDGWKPHDGGPCPVAPVVIVEVRSPVPSVDGKIAPAGRTMWWHVTAYRVLAYVEPKLDTPGPSDFVRETAARIMVACISNPKYNGNDDGLPSAAVGLAIALEKALQEVGK